jgi:hypothetical protein
MHIRRSKAEGLVALLSYYQHAQNKPSIKGNATMVLALN